jgi:hypothetical protein
MACSSFSRHVSLGVMQLEILLGFYAARNIQNESTVEEK